MTDNISGKSALVGETLVSLWHTALKYDWRALTVTNDAIHLIYLGKPNPLLAFFPIFGIIIMRVTAKNAYESAINIPIENRIDSHSNNITLHKDDIKTIQGSGNRIVITSNEGLTYKLNRMGDGDLMSMTAGFYNE